MHRLFSVCALLACCTVGHSQTIESAGGKWQKTNVTDKLTGETSTAYTLEGEALTAGAGIERRPRIVFFCKKSENLGRVQIYTGTVIENQSHHYSQYQHGWAMVTYRSDDQKLQSRPADIAMDGATLLADSEIISDFVAHKKFFIQYPSASGHMVTDEYLTGGLSVDSLKADCPSLFKK